MGGKGIGSATHKGLDFIVSLNFANIVRPWAIERVRSVNMREKYRTIGINKPTEVFLAPMEKSLCYDLAGKGKLDPRAAAGV